jgi:hypothetical protein
VDGTRVGSVEMVAKHLLALKKLVEGLPDGVHVYAIIEHLFGMLLQLPRWKMPYVFRILLEVCKEEDKAVTGTGGGQKFAPGAIAYGAEILFQLSPALDTFAARDLCDWLALHLSNTKFGWPFWEHWAQDAQENVQPGDAPEQFLRLLVQKCALLAPASRLTAHIPASLQKYLPEAPIARSVYLEEGGHGEIDDTMREVAKTLLKKIQDKDDPEDIADWLTDNSAVDSMANADARRAHILMHMLLYAGSHTVTHTIAGIDRLRTILQEVGASGEGAERAMIDAVLEVWASSPWHINFVLDACMRRMILLPRPGASSLLSDR